MKYTHIVDIILGVVTLIAAGLLISSCLPGDEGLIISKETTYILDPVTQDGRINYAAYLNDTYPTVSSPEKNAVRSLVEIFGPDLFNAFDESCFLFEDERPQEEKIYFISYNDFLKKLFSDKKEIEYAGMRISYSSVSKAPFDRSEDNITNEARVILDAWFKKNSPTLRYLENLADCDGLYFRFNENKSLIAYNMYNDINIPSIVNYTQFITLAVDYEIKKKNYHEAWNILYDLHKASGILINTKMQMLFLTGLTIENISNMKELLILNSLLSLPELSAIMLHDIKSLTEYPLSMIEVINHNRIMELDSFVNNIIPKLKTKGSFSLINTLLKEINMIYNEAIQGFTLYTYMEQKEYFEEFTRKYKDKGKDTVSPIIKRLFSGDNEFIIKKYTSNATATMVSTALRSYFKLIESRMYHQLIYTAIGCRLYYFKYGYYPNNLTDMQQESDFQVPTPLFPDRPIEYRKTGEGIVLYTIGENNIDDSGEGDDIAVKLPNL